MLYLLETKQTPMIDACVRTSRALKCSDSGKGLSVAGQLALTRNPTFEHPLIRGAFQNLGNDELDRTVNSLE